MGILCAGQLVADIIVDPVEDLGPAQETQRVENIVIRSGGDVMNTAVALAKLGNSVVFSGKVGDDDFGRFLTGELQSAGVDTRGLLVTKEAATASVVVLVRPDREHSFLYYGGAGDLFCCEDIDLALMDGCDIVHVGGTFNMPRFDGAGAAALFREAHKRGKHTSMDVSWDPSGRWLETIRPCLPHLDMFLPSVGEAKRITGREAPGEMADFLLAEGVGTAVIKLGKQGCLVKNAEDEFTMGSFDVPVVDTTGAGDSFVAGFLTGLQQGWNLRRCAEFASAVSAHSIQALGATTGIPGFEEVLRFTRENAASRRP